MARRRRRRGPYRGGKIHVCAGECKTCIFRPGNLMQLKPGRVAGMIAEAKASESAIVCHSTLDGERAVCRGFYDRHSTAPLALARALGVVEFVEPPS